MALVIVLFACKSDLKAVLVEQNLGKKYTDLVHSKEKNLDAKSAVWAEEKAWILQILKRLIALDFLVMLISWDFILVPWRRVWVSLQISYIKANVC